MPLRCSAPGPMQSRVQAISPAISRGLFGAMPTRITCGAILPSLAISKCGVEKSIARRMLLIFYSRAAQRSRCVARHIFC